MSNFAVIPMRDQVHYTRSLVTALIRQGETERIIICDNGSVEPESRWYLETIGTGLGAPVDVLDCAGMGIHRMWNLGMMEALARDPAPNIALLNNDIRIGPHFMSSLARGLRAYDDIWVTCPNYDGRDMLGADLATIHDVCAGRYDGTGGLCGFAFMLKGELVGTKLPWFDENLQWYCGDNQLAFAVVDNGGRMAIVAATTVEHLDGGSRTLRRRPPEFQKILDADIAYFQARYGVTLETATPSPRS